LPAIHRGLRYSVGESKFKIQKSKLLLSHPPDILLFFGRLHPLLVHLPIGLIVLLAGLELLARYPRFKHANTSAGFILALAVPLAIGTALCGWLLSLGGGYEARLVQWHKWTGFLTAAACAVTACLYRLPNKSGYRLCLGLNVLVLVLASHFGGSLTHGSDYLTRYAPASVRNLLARLSGQSSQREPTQNSTTTDPNTLPVFSSLVQPLLQKDCVSCHGPEKSKGHLRLDSFAALLQGGENGAVVVPGKAVDSELVKRLKLPTESDDHMPPDGKPQPGPDEIALLQWWIDAGASADKKVGDLHPPANVQRILAARFGAPPTTAKTTPPKPLQAVLPLAAQLSSDLAVVLAPISQTESWLQCNASVAGTNFGDAELARLVPLGPNLRWLDLGGTRITDGGLAQLAGFPNLSRLHLERTALTDAGLTSLTGLAQLEYLDLYGTAVTDAGLEQLQPLPRLKQLYLWQSQVTPGAAKAFIEARTDKDQIQRWQDEIEQLKAKIKDQAVSVELGTPVAAAPVTNATPMNAQCPISGKPVNPAKSVLHEATLIGFCCDDCKAQFLKDPKPVLAKLGLSSTNTESTPKAR
jgi:uncharacterized membrane protein